MKEFCPEQCHFKNNKIDDKTCEKILSYCYYFNDVVLEPFDMELTIKGKTETVTIVGENSIDNFWILSDGSRIHKNAPWITYKK